MGSKIFGGAISKLKWTYKTLGEAISKLKWAQKYLERLFQN
jgi:hypothetical protein